MQAKVNTSMRLPVECLSNFDELVRYYQRKYDAMGFEIHITKAQVCEILVNEKIREIKN